MACFISDVTYRLNFTIFDSSHLRNFLDVSCYVLVLWTHHSEWTKNGKKHQFSEKCLVRATELWTWIYSWNLLVKNRLGNKPKKVQIVSQTSGSPMPVFWGISNDTECQKHSTILFLVNKSNYSYEKKNKRLEYTWECLEESGNFSLNFYQYQ